MATIVARRQSQCDRKRPYRRLGDARKAMRRKQTNSPSGALCVYRCPHCGCYHVGHDITRQR